MTANNIVLIDREKCNGCAICLPACPVQAISITQGKAFIENSRCTNCLKCMEVCPFQAIYQILDQEDTKTKREEPLPIQVNTAISQSPQTLQPEVRKQQAIQPAGSLLNEIIKLAKTFLTNSPDSHKGFGGRGKGLHRSWKGRGRGRR